MFDLLEKILCEDESTRDLWWNTRHIQILNKIKQNNVDLIFVGDSITHDWETKGAPVWKQYYEPRNAVNMGFRGDKIEDVLWRLNNGEVSNISPKVAIVLIGVNNSIEGDSIQKIVSGIQTISTVLRNKLPKTKILLLGIFPNAEINTVEVNKGVSQLSDGEMIHYVDIGNKFLDDEGSLSVDAMPDLLHLSVEGYKIWAEAIESKLIELEKTSDV